MKSIFVGLLVAVLAGCATKQPVMPEAISYNQLAAIKVSNKDCKNIDYHINYVERQLKAKGLLYASPENLNDEDRKYNATARIIIWSLRIGCANPNRYAS
jgi:type IV pilus biogenesis protein CpaD/CtpE